VAEPTSHAAERVLIVDDDPATRTGLTELVRAWGFTAESASDGAEALARVTDFRPSIIVSDMVMPRMSGLDLLKALAGEVDQIKVILLPAQGTVDTAVEAVKAGAEDYLTKPLDPHKLQRLPERIFVLNYIKSYAQVVGLSYDEAVTRYEEIEGVQATPELSPKELERRRRKRAYVSLAVFSVLAAIGTWAAMVFYGELPNPFP